MAAGAICIFISAVTSEFGKARDGPAADLRSRDTLVWVQSESRHEAGAIRGDCRAIVSVIGTCSDAAAMNYRGLLAGMRKRYRLH
jgi:hypothetical protein